MSEVTINLKADVRREERLTIEKAAELGFVVIRAGRFESGPSGLVAAGSLDHCLDFIRRANWPEDTFAPAPELVP